MTEPGATTTNVAGDSAHVGMQAGTVHGDVNLYTLPPDASPEERFKAGVRYLDGGIPGKAKELIHGAAMAEYVDNKVQFYLLLALVSGRTRHELSVEDEAILRRAQNALPITDDHEWARGIAAIRRLLRSAQNPEADLRVVMEQFDELCSTQRALILTHMATFLEGPLKDQMWDRAVTEAEEGQYAGERLDRVWKFFHPTPAHPRRRPVWPVVISPTTWIQGVAATAAFVAAMLISVFCWYRQADGAPSSPTY